MKIAFITDIIDFQLDLYSICALQLAHKKQEHQIFIFYKNKTDNKHFAECPSNLVFIEIENQKGGSNIFNRFFFLSSLKKQMKKIEPDVVFFQKDNFIRDKWKTILFLNPYPEKIGAFLKNAVKKTDFILTYAFNRSSLLRYTSEEKIIRISPLLAKQEKEKKEKPSFRENHMDQHDYFLLYADNTENVVLFLKGYSQFRQWQKSQIRLCLFVPEPILNETAKKLENYRYRDAVVMMKMENHWQEATTEAFGNFMWSDRHELGPILLKMTSLKNPLFLPDNSEWRQLYEQKADFFENNEKSIFSAMTQLYKETLSTQEQAEARAVSFFYHDAHPTFNSIEKLLEP